MYAAKAALLLIFVLLISGCVSDRIIDKTNNTTTSTTTMLITTTSMPYTTSTVHKPTTTTTTSTSTTTTLLMTTSSSTSTTQTTTTVTTTTTLIPNSNITIHYIDVGQGDSILLQSPNGSIMLIDAGDNDKGDEVVSYLQNQKINKIDYFVTTHPDADHIGGADYVMNNIEVVHVLDNGQSKTTQTYQDYILLAKQKDYEVVKRNFTIPLDQSLGIEVLNPPQNLYGDTNDNSVVIKIVFNNVRFLFGGDCEVSCEEGLLNSGLNIDVDAYKVHHHGSDTSSTSDFLSRITPKTAIISVGKDNRYGHPKNVTLDRLTNIGAQIYRTDLNGTIRITSDGSNYSVIS